MRLRDLLLFTSISILLFTTCKTEENGDKCSIVNGFEVNQYAEQLIIYINSASGKSFEIAYWENGKSTDPGAIRIIHSDSTEIHLNLNTLRFESGKTYVFSIRKNCSENTSSAWGDEKSITISDFAYAPYALKMQDNNLTWQDSNSNPLAQRYHIIYGQSGFSILNQEGTLYSWKEKQFDKTRMYPGNDYDFYVQSYCGIQKGWSRWAGPITYHCSQYQDFCMLPSDISYTIDFDQGKPFRVNFFWEKNGQQNFQFVLVDHSKTIDNGSILNVPSGSFPSVLTKSQKDYDFYIRAVCNVYDTSAWVGPEFIKIP